MVWLYGTAPVASQNKKTTPYDFIVVGAGSAGCALAARVAQSGQYKVLLIEAGGVDTKLNINIHVPVACGKLQKEADTDWMYQAEKSETHSLGLIDGKANWPRGKVLGGSSAINYMAYVRGHKNDYDSWAKNGADESWSYENVLPYFKKMEGCVVKDGKLVKIEKNVHGFDGPLTVSVKNPPSEIASRFVEASAEKGFEIGDYNAPDSENKVSLMQQTVRNGARCSTARAYVHPALSNSDGFKEFDVLVGLHVARIALDKNGERLVAEGVVCIDAKSKVETTIFAKREVVVCGGAIGSPQILMLSGLGPKEELERHGIETKLNIPDVGMNLQDHLALIVRFNVKKNQSIMTSVNKNNAENLLTGGLSALFEWFTRGTGILSSSAYDATLFYKTGLNPDMNYPDGQIGIFVSGANEDLFQKNLGYTDVIRRYFGGNSAILADDNEGFLMVPTLLHPRSRGSIRLKSKNPLDNAVIDAGYFSDAEDSDVKTLVAITKKAIEIVQTSKAFEGLIDPTPIFPSDVVKMCGGDTSSDKFYETWARHYACTLYHPTSTCAMGKVLAPDCKVKGVDHLRVADASSMPHLISGNTNAPSILVGEVVADKICKEHAKDTSSASKL